jgi:hypothetical protein
MLPCLVLCARGDSLLERPVLKTVLPGGVEQHFSELPMRPEDKGESVEEHAERALVTYPFPQQVSTQNGRRLVASGSKVVRERLNGEYGLSQIWTIKVSAAPFASLSVRAGLCAVLLHI